MTPRVQRPDAVPTWTVEQARDGLAATGWHITAFTLGLGHRGSLACATDPESGLPVADCDKADVLRRNATLTAERDGLVLHGYAADSVAGKPGRIWVGGIDGTLFAQRSRAYVPLIVAGGLLGAFSGWLLTAALAYRIRTVPPGRARLATAFTGAALTMSALPVGAIISTAVMLGAHLSDTQRPVYFLHAVLRPDAYIQGSPIWLIPAFALAATAAMILAVSLLWGTTRQQSAGAAQPV